MELEGLLNGNQILIYFIGIFYILINDTFDKKQKIIILYVLTYILKLFNIMDLKVMLIALNIVSFLYIGFLSKDDLKNNILCNPLDKIKDYLYKCTFEYSAIYFLLSIILISNSIQNYIPLLKNINISIDLLEIKINVISLILLGYALNNVTSQKYETNSFQEIKNKMDKVAIWTNLDIKNIDNEKLEMLIDIEDKSYFIRERSYNFISIEFLKYRLCRKKVGKINLKVKPNRVKEILLQEIHIKSILKKVKRYIRGYSTIEMQIIRTLGVKYGYSKHIICRKIYELLYSKMFFKNLRKYMNKSYLNTEGCASFKQYLLIIYIGIAPIKINKKRYSNMLKVWNKTSVKDISKEQFFISILGLSNRKISNEIIHNYYGIVEKYQLSKKELKRLIEKINKE